MNCSNCGTYNEPQSKFCAKCGNALNANNLNQPMAEQVQQPVQPQVQPQMRQPMNQPINQSPADIAQPMVNAGQPMVSPQINNNVQTSPTPGATALSINYLKYIINVLLKPFQTYKEEENKFDTKNSLILTLILTLVMTLSNLIQTVISEVRVMNFSWTEGYTHSWEWANLKDIKWLEVIGKNFLIYAGIILAITVVFYLGNLVVKKQLSFMKSLSITATSFIPAVCGMMILSPILGKIWSPLSMLFSIVGIIYFLIILYELMNNELNLEKDKKIYFNLICLGILVVAGYFVGMKLLMSSITGGLGDILDLLK